MKNLITSLICMLTVFSGFSQNYFEEYPINIILGNNGSLQRIECSVYDSVLQSTVIYNTDWVPYTIVISGNVPGKVGYTLWNSPFDQNSTLGYIIYDSYNHEFVADVKIIPFPTGDAINVICGPIWIELVHQSESVFGDYSNSREFYRYSTVFKKWISVLGLSDWSLTPNIWTFNYLGNTDRVKNDDDNSFIYYDPVIDSMHYEVNNPVGNINWYNKDWEDCFIGEFLNSNYNKFQMYDPQLHQLATHPRSNLVGDEVKGIFFANDYDSTFKKFFFLYDLSIQQWVTDSVYSSQLTNIKITDRVVAYIDSTVGFSKKVFYMVYNPLTHSWIKDSTSIAGVATGFQIQNGTILWSDSNGLNIKGYDSVLGWGNFNTTMLLNFHLTNFTSQGYNMIHVRNYSIGYDSVYFDFGDGVISSNTRNVLWHTYNESGIYDVCIHHAFGTSSWCQQITMNICSYSGNISVANDTLCEGDSTLLSISSQIGTIQWQSKIDSTWIDEIGPGATTSNYIIYPTQSTSYRAKITNGTCVPAYSTIQFVKYYANIANYNLSDSTYTKCSNLYSSISVNAENVTYQWQKFDGNVWSNVANGTYASLQENYNATSEFRVILKSGNCFVDTSEVITMNAIQVPANPAPITGFTCGPGNVLLQAVSGSPNHYWYTNVNDSILHVGNTFYPFISTNTTYKVKAIDGALISIGYPDQSIGSTGTSSPEEKGIQFFCSTPVTLEYLYLYPTQSGYVQFIIRKNSSQHQIAGAYELVQAGTGPAKIWLDFNLAGNTVYDLVMLPGSVPLEVNTSGVNYPISAPGSPVTILGYVDSTLHTTNDYYNFYDLHFTTGCRSGTSNAIVTYHAAFNIANITAGGPLSFCRGDSVKLSAYLNNNFGYEWKRNGTTVASSGNNYWASSAGAYTVIMNNGICYDTSSAVVVRIPCIPTSDPVEKNDSVVPVTTTPQFAAFYDASTGNLVINADVNEDEKYLITLMDQAGKEFVCENYDFIRGQNQLTFTMQSYASGLYIIKFQSNKHRFIQRTLKTK